MTDEDFSQVSMLSLFQAELETQSQALTSGLLALERDPVATDALEECMRAAHSLKGAARIIDLTPAVKVANAMEDCLVAAQRGHLRVRKEHIDALLQGSDLLKLIASGSSNESVNPEVESFLAKFEELSLPEPAPQDSAADFATPEHSRKEPAATSSANPLVEPKAQARGSIGSDRMVRVTAESLNRLLGLAGESLMEARRLRPFADGLLRLKHLQSDIASAFDNLDAVLLPVTKDAAVVEALVETQRKLRLSQAFLAERLDELDSVDRKATDLANRLYEETLASRMRPFEDGVRHYARTVRDLGRTLGKRVRLEIIGGSTGIDRDILEQLDAPLGHLLRNAVDHGLEPPDERLATGKPEEGLIRLEARHNAGLLQIAVVDDGRGIELSKLRETVVARQFATRESADALSETELLAFLFLPGFSMKVGLSDVSGRGVGLDAVQAMTKEVRGITSVSSEFGRGTRFQLQLPLTLSVLRTLLVEVDGEPYAFPLAAISKTMKLQRVEINLLQGRPHFRLNDRQIGLVTAREVLDRGESASEPEELSVVVVETGRGDAYGVIVDRFLGERELVIRPLDSRFAKIKDISAAALMEDGSPVLIFDVNDLVRSVEKLASSSGFRALRRAAGGPGPSRRKRVLVIDDSLTVRELQRKMLGNHGYDVEVAVDGMDGWNAVRSGPFDLVVTDIDMPRMDGIELVSLIRKDVHLRNTPIMIVSYKDREEDRSRGLDAGADYYLTKSTFQDEALIHAVVDMIGEATE
ncbi:MULTISPECIES: hybrid sensor histidine kinase/response regulator [unclassified Mesorhizobium]|uniref:hybrid sensor histidine kinase/response regulator n=1 Tax=unclassified Mesorhizobium TaxID=325217 RepID=UPI001129779A|nr:MULTISPECIES: hybrid sensor histidine kinase/response regulator [unclassified Mesorhizobium]TPK68671.1 hybrid sensor histidine kinase/response regulator [Mesorhizobium sp. B2-5-1]TPM62916.1 hybrid sensor histidine kinase/response regulator [Mesorhizobium sp. B2-1-9]TPM79764.1 hybrid sensor histidine kinase/response regulator [Mesorhizobium sp. B2-1-4]TPN04323.1 hybrid sensor histidine kinase/response regulator [Mesorhizobium sp. B2-1-2]UCI15389.1 hybrid sensor histidine kinase/response regu